MTLDLTKPMRWKLDHTPVIVLWSDDNDVFAEWRPPYDEPVRQHMRTEWFSERAENIPPEPPKPVGPDEVTVSVWPDGAMSLMHGHPPAVQVRYLRADLAEKLEARIRELHLEVCALAEKRKVRPLTDEECDDLLTKFEQGGLGYLKARRWYEKIMAARGIEVGE